ncbi:MAG TPA: fumarylacetoacetate hydrolase, partial [Stellaceae bacterium]|nr:fumarylacetoacetate hydrolase [Stellaceae bacterium]
QTIGAAHQYPDGFVLFCGTMFAPTEDRGEKGQGFTHRRGDIVTISSPKLGALVNRVETSDRLPRWDFGTRALLRHLARRGVL